MQNIGVPNTRASRLENRRVLETHDENLSSVFQKTNDDRSSGNLPHKMQYLPEKPWPALIEKNSDEIEIHLLYINIFIIIKYSNTTGKISYGRHDFMRLRIDLTKKKTLMVSNHCSEFISHLFLFEWIIIRRETFAQPIGFVCQCIQTDNSDLR